MAQEQLKLAGGALSPERREKIAKASSVAEVWPAVKQTPANANEKAALRLRASGFKRVEVKIAERLPVDFDENDPIMVLLNPVKVEIEQAMRTWHLMRVKGCFPAKLQAVWPDHVRGHEAYGYDDAANDNRVVPSNQAISKADMVYVWLIGILNERERFIVSAFSVGMSWRWIGEKIKRDHKTVKNDYLIALFRICCELQKGTPQIPQS
ncbi:DUF6362 family protein [Dongia sp.]|uniref:DUF6362 family protein n=1 Tax=Dongia sp. TaxID=1977262 RepID=UPI0035B43274